MAFKRPLPVRPLTHDLTGATASFSCGVRKIDDYLRDGMTIQDANLARIFVALDPSSKTEIVGYYAMHNMHIEADALPLPHGRMVRRDAIVGGVSIVMFAVNGKHQNQGIGTALFVDALRSVERVSAQTSVWAIVLDALNDRAERFYRRFGFDTLVSGTRRLYLPTSAVPE